MSSLNSEKVEYLLVGGYAIIHYGRPRATGDMDIWVGATPENAERVVRALNRFGFRDPSINPSRFQAAGQVFRMGVAPLRIEILTSVSGLAFEPAYARRATVRIDDVDVSVIHLDDLKTNKRHAGRRKDMDDLDALP